MSEEAEVEVDPSKSCNRRYDHRDVVGQDSPAGRICPACVDLAE